MNQFSRVEIPFNRYKLWKALLTSILFVLLGFWLIIFQPQTSNPVINAPYVKWGAGLLCILFFSWAAVTITGKLRQKKPGIILDEKGVYDMSAAHSVGLIPWSSIIGISRVKVMKQEMLLLKVNDPDVFINKATAPLHKKSMSYNLAQYGTPIAISVNGLSCKLDELDMLLRQAFREHTGKDLS